MATRIMRESVAVRASNLPLTRIQDDVIALDEHAGLYYAMNSPGARIWELVDQPVTVATVCEVISREFAVSDNMCFNDVVEFLAEMRDRGLITLC